MLEWIGTKDPTGAWRRNLPDVTTEFPFEIPAGRYLVITDVDWQFRALLKPARQNVTLRLSVALLDDLTNSQIVHQSTLLLDDFGYGGISEALTTGFVVDESATLIWHSNPESVVSHVLLRGYLIDRQ
ncbi:MAG: hypothetical protein B7X34_05505 [Acidobacteriia bacterium 12-62-4]|nr:MAG: hypothetical protein B7X34_05505 [Acidobacteriia bacterium 12-62-4]